MTRTMNAIPGKHGFRRKSLLTVVSALILIVFTVSLAHGAFFDNAGQSARAMGFGEVFLASSSDAMGYWYNPAGLSKIKTKQIGIGYGKPAAFVSDLMTSQVNFALPMGERGGLGLGFAYSGIDVASDMVLSGAYGISLSEKFMVGGNIKIMRWSADGQPIAYGTGTDEDLSKTSFSLDLSAAYAFGKVIGLDDLELGVYVKDAIMPNISESGNDGGKLPIEAGLGLMVQKKDVFIEGDVAAVDGVTIFRLGAESGITGTSLKVRGGFVYGSDFEDELEETDFDIGFGYKFSSIVFDYAYNYPVAFKETGGKHYVSFGISF